MVHFMSIFVKEITTKEPIFSCFLDGEKNEFLINFEGQ